MKQINCDDLLLSKINNILKSKKIEFLGDIEFSENLDVSILYPTDDYLLDEFQFQSIVSLLDKKDNLYVMQLGEDSYIHSLKHELYQLGYPYSYEEYKQLNFYSISVIFSSKLDWILIIDESLDGGIGILGGDSEIVDIFEKEYGKTKKDMCKLVKFFIEDSNRNKHALLYMKKIFDLLQ